MLEVIESATSSAGLPRVGRDSRRVRVRVWLTVAMICAVALQVCLNRGLLIPSPKFHRVFCDSNLLLAAAACWIRGGRASDGRAAWRVQAAALVSYLLGDLYAEFVLRNAATYPSIADAFWLCFYALSFVAIALYTRDRLTEFHASTWLDAAIGGFGASALVAAFVLQKVITLTHGSPSAVAVNLCYPMADLLLLMLLFAVGHALRWSDRTWLAYGGGMVLYLTGDIYYLVAQSRGTYVADKNPLELSWTAGIALIGLTAAVLIDGDRRPATAAHRYLMPCLFALVAVGLLISGQWRPLPIPALVLTVVVLILTTIRVAITFREARRLAISKLEARTDYLTGLPNRRHLAERLTSDLGEAATAQTALIVIDLDRFKEVNDSLGHVVGDRLLQHTSRRLAQSLPPRAFLARLGGDEFAVLLPGHDSDSALAIAGSLAERLREPFDVAGIVMSIPASAGVAVAPDDAVSADELMSCADIAMYQAKRAASGAVKFRVERANPSREKLCLLADLREALHTDALICHYQPQLALETSSLYGVEALVRWRHPVRGLLHPQDFLPLAADSGLISAVTEVVLHRALADFVPLGLSNESARLSVNICATDLANPAFPAIVARLLSTAPVGVARRLTLEVTEEAVMSDRATAVRALHGLREVGVGLAVDDFGTGHSSLAYLRDLPITEIKLDGTFLRGVPGDTHNEAIVRSTVELAHSLGLPIVAEGIENQRSWSWLAELGCDVGQGYVIARPMPADRVSSWLVPPAIRWPAPAVAAVMR